MIMLVELDNMICDFSAFVSAMKISGEENGVDIRVMHEDIFNTMHKI
jgi:ACT domain-containing protein